MIVLDASAVVEILKASSVAPKIRSRMMRAGSIHAPHLVDIEVIHALRKHEARGEMEGLRCRLAMSTLADLPLVRYPLSPLLDRIWDLRQNLTAYDAAYVALAESLGAPLVTCDKRLKGAPGHSAQIELF